MLQAFFHAWERRLASVTTDRVVRPFEWGLEWIHRNGEPDEHSRHAGDADDPARALSDGANALRLDRLEPLLRKLTRIHAAARGEAPTS